VNRLRIGVDARELLGAATGVGRYLGELLLRWTSRADAGVRTFLLYTPEPLPLQLPAGTAEHRVVSAGTSRGTWWEQVHLRRAIAGDPPDVFFAPAYTAPVLHGVRLALTIHDVAFAARPDWFRVREGLRRRVLTRRSADAASVVFTDSQFSRSEIQAHLGVSRDKIQVISPGIAPRHARREATERREPLILYVGSIFNRRRLPDLIAAFAQVVRQVPGATLVIVGDDRTWPPQPLPEVAASLGVAGLVDIRSYVADEELAGLYARASAFAFLSEYEGFGLTPLEALAAGVPIVVLDTPVAREIYGGAALYVQHGDVSGTAEALTRLLRDPSSAGREMSAAAGVLARYSWDRCATETLSHIERIASR
jgi:glycosyltransferase involved in cell wall biosynthesis